MDIGAESERLRSLARSHPNANARAVVEAALTSKYEGLQSLAAQALGAWADRESTVRLKLWLDSLQARQYGWAIRGVAARALSNCVTAEDADWVLDRLFATPQNERHVWQPIIRSLPWSALHDRLGSAISSPNVDERRAALFAVIWHGPQDHDAWLQALVDDPDPLIQKAARFNLGMTVDLGPRLGKMNKADQEP